MWDCERNVGAPSNRDRSKAGQWYESGGGRSSDLSRKSKNSKTPCLNVKRAKTRPASKKIFRSNGTLAMSTTIWQKQSECRQESLITLFGHQHDLLFSFQTVIFTTWPSFKLLIRSLTRNASSYLTVVLLNWSHLSVERVSKLYLVKQNKEVNPFEVP